MRTRLLIGMLLVALAAFAGDKLQRLNVRTGQWEVTTTINTQGQLPISPELLARMSPEQRARMQARMNAQPGQRSRTITHKDCVTEKELERAELFSTKPNQECTQNIVSSSSIAAEIHIVCEAEGMKGEGTVKIQVLSPESTKGSSHMTGSGGGHTMTSDSTFTAKWVSASCSK